MVSYLNKILERANIQVYMEYLLHGNSLDNIDNLEFQKKEERIKEAYHNCLNIIEKYDSAGEESELYSVIMKSISEYENIYAELGFQAGLIFTKDILSQTNETQIFHHKILSSRKTIDENSKEEQNKNNFLYNTMSERINLQSIGCFLKDGSQLKKADKTTFADRQYRAETELEDELNKILDEQSIEKVLPLIIHYSFVNEQIQFSLGMKSGAKLALILTDDSQCDY